MIQISYISTAPQQWSTDQLLALMQQCLANNTRRGLTGLLLYGNETFLQSLEGEEAAVDETYAKILQDPRHTGIKFLHRKQIERRQYADWSMGFKRVSDQELQHIDGLKDFHAVDFNAAFLSEHAAMRDLLMDHFSYWDPLVRAVEEKDHAIKSLKASLRKIRCNVEIARLVLESVAQAARSNSVSEAHLRLCEETLETLN